MAQPEESEMNTNEETHPGVPEDAVVLGIASTDTLGNPGMEGEIVGALATPGIR